MPKRTDLRRILLIGSGPIVIGQGAEFDYSGTQAVKALKEEGYQVVLVNSNPATIMTDPELADRTYVEPVTPEWVRRVIERERPDALLPTMGGQTALNVAMALARDGTLERCGVQLIGANARAIQMAEDRAEARSPGQRGDRMLDRERGPHGRAHRRFDHRGARHDTHGPRVPAHARCRDRHHPRDRRRSGRLQHPVRRQPGGRRDARDR